MLVHYGSPSPSPEPVAASASTTTHAAIPPPPVFANEVDEDDEEDEEFNLANSFAIQSDAPSAVVAPLKNEIVVRSAPDVLLDDPSKQAGSGSLITRASDSMIFYNPRYDDMSRPVEGPINPWDDRKLTKMNTLTGNIEVQSISALSFKEQQRSFDVLGYAANPSIVDSSASTSAFVGNVHEAWKNGGDLIGERKIPKSVTRAMKRKRKGKGTLGEFDEEEEEEEEEAPLGEGELAPVDADGEPIIAQKREKADKVQKEYLGPWAGWEDEYIGAVGPTAEQWEEQAEDGGAPLTKKQRKQVVLDEGKREIGFGEEKSIFHGKDLHDYLGRSYLHIPTDVDVNLSPSEPGLQECFKPKKCVHTYSGHTKGVSKIQLFPGSGHLILSGSLDTRIKLWDVYHEGKCLRTFMGHSKGIHDITFNNDGTKFLSAAFDRQMKLWDTETGQCLKAFSNGKIPYCVKFHPDKQNIFLAGMSDKKIIQYDIGSGELVQEYDQHLGPVNTINFVDENRRFITTSDDKTIRVWDYDIPVVIKYIAEPSMHSMPAVGMLSKWMAMQSLDNQILIFGTDSYKQNRKKRFAGHTVAGYACEPQFSPDGRFISSGDGQGSIIFWDWKTCRISGRMKAHNGPLISHRWLPHSPSGLVTSSWDGLIKLWN